ncbi:diphosphomevalonate decarboxylase [Patescibacteria group bacterium]
MKTTVVSPANIAFIKYWGRSDHKLFLPRNNSISMTIDGCLTTTTAEILDDLDKDIVEVQYYGRKPVKIDSKSRKSKALFEQIARIRKDSKRKEKVKIESVNNFPSDAGIAASASSFSALTAALLVVYGQHEKFENKREFSRQVRLCGSGSAVRSCYGGFVEFALNIKKNDAYARQLSDENHWDLLDIVVVVDPGKKKYSSSHGHELADTSPYFETRISEMNKRIRETKKAIKNKDLEKLGTLIEQDSTSMHAIMMTSKPPIYYWNGASMKIMQEIIRWREEDNLLSYFTLDAGPNVHVICEAKDKNKIVRRLKRIEEVQFTIVNKPSEGTRIINKHLF